VAAEQEGVAGDAPAYAGRPESHREFLFIHFSTVAARAHSQHQEAILYSN
jgi:hypothetical protein